MKNENIAQRRRIGGPEDIAQLLLDYQHSGLTQRQYAQQIGMGYSTLTKWIRRARSHPTQHSVKSKVDFVPVHSLAPRSGSLYELRWPHGLSFRVGQGFDPAEVRQLLSLLPPCSP